MIKKWEKKKSLMWNFQTLQLTFFSQQYRVIWRFNKLLLGMRAANNTTNNFDCTAYRIYSDGALGPSCNMASISCSGTS